MSVLTSATLSLSLLSLSGWNRAVSTPALLYERIQVPTCTWFPTPGYSPDIWLLTWNLAAHLTPGCSLAPGCSLTPGCSPGTWLLTCPLAAHRSPGCSPGTWLLIWHLAANLAPGCWLTPGCSIGTWLLTWYTFLSQVTHTCLYYLSYKSTLFTTLFTTLTSSQCSIRADLRVVICRLSAVQCSALHISAVQWSEVECSGVECSGVQWSAVECSGVQEPGWLHCEGRESPFLWSPIQD